MFCYGSTEGSLSPPTFLCVGCKVLLETIGGGGAETGGRTPRFARRGEQASALHRAALHRAAFDARLVLSLNSSMNGV